MIVRLGIEFCTIIANTSRDDLPEMLLLTVGQGEGQRDRSIYIKYVIPNGAAARVSVQI